MEKAYELFLKSWNQIKQGIFFDEQVNNIFDYTIKSLWKSEYKHIIKANIIQYLPKIFIQYKSFEKPIPLFYILISLKDEAIIKEMQSLLLLDWIKLNGSEESTFQLLNFIETFSEKQIPIEIFIKAIIKNINSTMSEDMLEALAHMITIAHSEYMSKFVKKFFSMPNKTILKNFVQMSGKPALVQLLQLTTPGEVQKIFK